MTADEKKKEITKRRMRIDLSEIKRDVKYRTREVSPYVVRKIVDLIASGYFPPPIQVVEINKMYFLIDGWHRIEAWDKALQREGEIPVEVVEGLSDYNDMMEYAIQQNHHGRPYTVPEKKNLLKTLIKKEHWTNNKAREVLKISDQQVTEWGGIDVILFGGKNERAMPAEKSTIKERANGYEKPSPYERAEGEEKSNLTERATKLEKPNRCERATQVEKPTTVERTNAFPVLFYSNKLIEWMRAGDICPTDENVEVLKKLSSAIEQFTGE